MRALAIILSVVLGVAIGVAAHKFAPKFPQASHSASASAAPATSDEPAASASAAESASAPTAEASADTPPPPPPEKASVCMKALFPDKTFPGEPALEFVCDEENPIKGATRVKEAIVAASGRGTSNGQREWAVLGFYELAAYASLRGRCCPNGATFTVPDTPETCESMKGALTKIAGVSRLGASDDDAQAATKSFGESVKCIVANNMAKAYGGYAPPSGGEGATFGKTLDRARGVPPKKKDKEK